MDKTKTRMYLLIWLIMAVICLPGCVQHFIYHPSSKIELTPAAIGLTFESVIFSSQDGVRLSGWWVPARPERGIVLFCHGIGGNISHQLDGIMILNRLGMSIFIFDYRGFGLSEGSATESGTRLDAEAAWAYLVHTRQIAEKRIVIYGRSLGGAVAAELARKRSGRALIIESAFTSLRDIAEEYLPGIPALLFSGRLYNTWESLRDYPNWVLIIHSPDDEVVPFRHGMLLYRAALGSKQFLEIRGSHNRGPLDSLEAYEEGIRSFLTAVFAKDEPGDGTKPSFKTN